MVSCVKMATLEDEIRDLRERNNELVQKVQYWKVAAANKENEKLELMKEINELRLKLSRLRSGGAAEARKLDAALQSSSEEALTHLVKASSAVARTIELAKTYMQDRQDLDYASPRWSAIGGTPNSERVHRVPPLLIGGQSIQPVVSLSRTLLNTSNSSLSRSMNMSRSPNQNRSVTERAVPMHMLQDVYIPLTRIDVSEFPGNHMETETESNDLDNSTEDLGLEDSAERSAEDSQNMSESDDFESSRRLEAVTEDVEPEDIDDTPPRVRTDNPLEGPSWLLDRPTVAKSRQRSSKNMNTLEPDSTTQLDENSVETQSLGLSQINEHEASMVAHAFTPTVRRRKRTSTPPRASRRDESPSPVMASRAAFSPRPALARRNSNSGRVLKVLVAKMRLDSDSDSDDDVTPAKRPALAAPVTKRLSRELVRDSTPTKKMMRFDAPSPNGATDARVIVLEQNQNSELDLGSGEPVAASRRAQRAGSRDGRKARRDCGDAAHADTPFGDRHTHTKDGQTRLPDGESRREESKMDGSNDSDRVTHRGARDNDTSGSGSHRKGNAEQRSEDSDQSNDKKSDIPHRKCNINDGDRVTHRGARDNERPGNVSHRKGNAEQRSEDSDQSNDNKSYIPHRKCNINDGDRVTHRGARDNERPGNVSHRKGNAEQRSEDSDQSNDKKSDIPHRKCNIEHKNEDNDQSNVSRQGLGESSERKGSVACSSDNLSRLGSLGDHTGRMGSVGAEGRDSDSSTEQGEGRIRRPRKQVTYKEKPLNRKLRR